MAHVKGPLYVHSYARDSHSILTQASGHEVANCRTRDNAQLFAAAPDLLTACEALIGRWEHDHTVWDRKTQSFPPYDQKLDCEEVKQARAANAAARGTR